MSLRALGVGARVACTGAWLEARCIAGRRQSAQPAPVARLQVGVCAAECHPA